MTKPVKKIKCTKCKELMLKVYPIAYKYEDFGKRPVKCNKCDTERDRIIRMFAP